MATKTKRPNQRVSEQLRTAMQDSGLSLYRIAKGSGVSYPVVYRFCRGTRTIMGPTMDRLCQYLRLELRSTEKGA